MPIVQKEINWNDQIWLKAVNAVAEMNGWTAAIIRTWPIGVMERRPIAVSKMA